MFKPPDSARRNGKSPKLSLPQVLRSNNNDGAGIASAGNDLHGPPLDHLQRITPPYSSAEVKIPRQNQTPPSSSSSIYSRTPSKQMKKRPLPPPIPSSVLSNLKDPSQSQSSPMIDKTTSSLSKLQITEPQISYTKQEFSASTDSYQPASVQQDNYEKSSSTLDSQIAGKDIDQLEENVWEHPMLKNQIETLGVLGEGAGGAVAKCKLKNGGNKIFALKTINTLNTDPEYQKQIFRELQFNKSFESDYIVKYYGMFVDQQNSTIYIAMEYMGGRSLDAVYKNLSKRGGRISEKVLGKIAEAVLRGLSYLHERKIIHRDIKPQNILLNLAGQVKLCDFGVSGEAVNSLATTFTGTSYYMAPERIKGQPYSVTCDVWSLGLTLLEVAQGKFPFGSDKMTANVAPIELLTMILTFTPELKDEPELNIYWSKAFKSFIEYCLKKEARERPSPRQMISHPWIQGQMKKKTNMAKFVNQCWEGDH